MTTNILLSLLGNLSALIIEKKKSNKYTADIQEPQIFEKHIETHTHMHKTH